MAGAREWTTIEAAAPSQEKAGRVAASATGKGINKEEATPEPSGVASIRSFDFSAGGMPDQYFYWMASLKPLPARNPGVFDAAM